MGTTPLKPGLGCRLAKLLAGVDATPGISVIDGINTAAHTARGAVLLMAIVFGLLAFVPPAVMRLVHHHRNQSLPVAVPSLADMGPAPHLAQVSKNPEGTSGLVQVVGTEIKSTFNEDTIVTDKRDAILLSRESAAPQTPSAPARDRHQRGKRASAAVAETPAPLPSVSATAPLLRGVDAPPDDVLVSTAASQAQGQAGMDSMDMLLSASSAPVEAVPAVSSQAAAVPEGFSLNAESSTETARTEGAVNSDKVSYRKAPPLPQENPWNNNWIRLSLALLLPIILVLSGARLRRAKPLHAEIIVRLSMVCAFALVLAAPVVAFKTGWRQGLFCFIVGAAESYFCRAYMITRFGWIPYALMEILRNRVVRGTLQKVEQMLQLADDDKPPAPPRPPLRPAGTAHRA